MGGWYKNAKATNTVAVLFRNQCWGGTTTKKKDQSYIQDLSFFPALLSFNLLEYLATGKSKMKLRSCQKEKKQKKQRNEKKVNNCGTYSVTLK